MGTLRRVSLPALILLLAWLPSSVVPAAIPLLQREWAASGAAVGWVFAAYQIGYALSVLLLLPLTDRIPTRRLILACAFATSVSSLLFPLLAQGVWSAIALRFLAGLGLAGIYMPGVRLVAASAPAHRRGLMVATYVAASFLGTALSLWLTGLLLPGIGWRGAAYALGAASLLALPLALLGIGAGGPPVAGRARLDPKVLRDGPVMRTVTAYTGHAWELYICRGWLAAFVAAVLVASGLDTKEAAASGGQWAALMSACGVPGVFLGGWLSDRLGRARTALLIAGSSGLASLGFGFLGAGSWALLVAVGCLYGLLVSADSPVYSTAVTELAVPGRLGSAQAVQACLGFGATIVAPVAAGWFLDLGLGWNAVFALAGIVGIASALPLLPLGGPFAQAGAKDRGT